MSSVEPFLDSFNSLSIWTRLFALNNFPFPKACTKHFKLKISLRDKTIVTLKVCLSIIFFVMSNTVLKTSTEQRISSVGDYIMLFLGVSGFSVLFTNLYIETQYRHRIWAIISGLCNVDYVVCSNHRLATFIANIYSVICFVQLFLLDEKTRRKNAQQKSTHCQNDDNYNQRFRGDNELGGLLFEIWI